MIYWTHSLKIKETFSRQIKPSKYPTAFNIDIHIDDSKGIEIEGEKYNFQTIIIDENMINWTSVILERT